ncbi:EAL domain-containing response regulator [Aerosticca soli]|uniref:Diguanylate cyclase n=1 Tax=Aerosticca soli TaxID=2010829 RepID=A0A2Z6E6U5_9GAMM|nr:bifunctional diguanylate cyclase/phosphodiesterase [Aerosticca soli]BBD80404.1 diguanylate cyclase [Aerosticca soli]
MNNDAVIKILFLDKSLEEAEQVISLLRNAGIAVRPSRAGELAQVRPELEAHDPDLVLFDPQSGIALRELMGELDAHGRDLALVALVDRLDNQIVAELSGGGVRGMALRTHPQQLIAVLLREFESLRTRRQVRLLEAALRESERRCDALLDSSTDPIAYVHDGMHVRANRAYLETFGFETLDDLLGLPVLDLIGTADTDAFKQLLRAHARGEKADTTLTLSARRADASTFQATAEFSHATFEGEPCLQIVFRRQQVDPALLEQLQRDPVTGLYNRGRLLECIDEAVTHAAKGTRGQALLLIEPDHWQDIVANIGLGQADELLAAFAERVRRHLEPDDAAGMLAEHTLGVVLAPRSDEAVHAWIDTLQQTVASGIFDLGTHSITVTASIGGSLLGERNANAELLLGQASQALRSAQTQGLGRVELHDPAAREKAEEERERAWLELIREALARNGFILYQQPVISLQDAEGEFAEILLRMQGPQGEVLPGFFLPIAEKHGLTVAIDRWVIDRALDALKAREMQGVKTTFFVKLAAATLQDEATLPWLAERMARARLRHGRLVLETTESKVMTLLRPAQAFIAAWKGMGGGFALEQFGSGLNSFQLLRHVDADYLKIDRSYMAQLPRHPEHQQKITEICQQARELGKLTIAEWVEDAASTSLLFACGVDFVQGNFLQEPQRLD